MAVHEQDYCIRLSYLPKIMEQGSRGTSGVQKRAVEPPQKLPKILEVTKVPQKLPKILRMG